MTRDSRKRPLSVIVQAKFQNTRYARKKLAIGDEPGLIAARLRMTPRRPALQSRKTRAQVPTNTLSSGTGALIAPKRRALRQNTPRVRKRRHQGVTCG